MGQTFGHQPLSVLGLAYLGASGGIFCCCLSINLHLVYSYVRWSGVIHAAPILISVTSCFSPTQKMLRWCTQQQTATKYKK